ncbi:MAG: hypothetical protein ABSA54_24465 [Terriglobales bacterium]
MWRFLVLLTISLYLTSFLNAQEKRESHYELYGGYTLLSNSFNGKPGATQPLNGGEFAIAFPAWHNLRFTIDVYSIRGSNLNAQQHAIFITGGGKYSHRVGKVNVFGEALLGDVGINRYWGPNSLPGQTASLTAFLGGGIDTPVSRRFAFRLAGGYQYTNFFLVQSVSDPIPYQFPGEPNNFARIASGVVWKF